MAVDAFSLAHFLPAGVLELTLQKGFSVENVRRTARSEDGWHSIFFAPPVQDNALFQELAFLVQHQFIAVTFELCKQDELCCCRVYLIPSDLANIQGRLRVRNRDTTILAKARPLLQKLLQRLKINWGSELHGKHCNSSAASHFLPRKIDSRTMSEIYSDISSPFPPHSDNPAILRLLKDDLQSIGMRSTLYEYQRVSVAAMCQKETIIGNIPDPLYVCLQSVEGRQFFLQPSTLEVLQECPIVTPVRGGLLCQELGTGKTVMVLALILSTLHEISSPEESFVESHDILTPVALRHFPGHQFVAARQRLKVGKRSKLGVGPQLSRVPSLTEILIHHIRTSSHALANIEAYEEQLLSTGLMPRITSSVPFYHLYEESIIIRDNERFQRHQSRPGPRVVYLTRATLVVMPFNLIAQWEREIHKHSSTPLQVFTFARKTDKLPSAKCLATQYDIILTTYSKLSDEYTRRDVNKLHTQSVLCNCSEFPGTRIPDCKCNNSDSSVSPFLQVRWKRLVIDEGHVASSPSTNFNHFISLLSIEKKWIVTGTPTTNLLGLSFGAHATETSIVPQSTETSSVDDHEDNNGDRVRVWTTHDREDLRKMAHMLTTFLGFQFSHDELFRALLDPTGPQPYSIQVFVQLMEFVMIRHRIEDIEKEVILPSIHKETVLLDLDPFQIKSYNAFIATLVVNAIDSERKDKDYMFHPTNAALLIRAVANMSQIMFWSSDTGLYNIVELLRLGETRTKTAKERCMPTEDQSLLADALRHVRDASEDNVWKAIHTHEDVPFRIQGIKTPILNAWARPGLNAVVDPSLHSSTTVGLIHLDRLIALRQAVVSRPLAGMALIVASGEIQAQEDLLQRQAFENLHKSRISPNKRIIGASKPVPAVKPLSSKQIAEMKETLNHELLQMGEVFYNQDEADDHHPIEENDSMLPTFSPPLAQEFSPLLEKSPSGLATVRVSSSGSSKLNYILNEVLKYSATEKFLIFSNSPLTLAHLAQGLELISVQYLNFSTAVKPDLREQIVVTFETSEKYRAFLMELKHGARGLNLVAASRVIFCEPVWQADVESQAIKRAHRIGQTRAITVKTLAIRDTAEENMMLRRAALALTSDGTKIPSLTNDRGMRHYIEHPRFIEHAPTLVPILDVPLITLPFIAPVINENVSIDETPVASASKMEMADAQPESPYKKRRTGGVRFADN